MLWFLLKNTINPNKENKKAPKRGRGEIMDKKIEFTILKENMLQLQVCCNLSPEEMKERQEEFEALMPFSGTRLGWRLDWNEAEEYAPVKCGELDGFWHYILWC